MAKTLTRAEMKRAAMALGQANMGYSYYQSAKDWGVKDFNGLAGWNNGSCLGTCAQWIRSHEKLITGLWRDEGNSIQASMLLSEAYRPAGHDGDGKDD